MTDVEVLFAAIPVADFADGLAWYSELFGRPADIVVKDDEVMWGFSESAWLYVVLDRRRAGNGLVTLSVGDLDAVVAGIASRGITGSPIEAVGDAGRKATYVDPEGNTVSFVEVAGSQG